MTKDKSKKAKLDTAVLEQDDEEEQIELNTSKTKIFLSQILLHLTK